MAFTPDSPPQVLTQFRAAFYMGDSHECSHPRIQNQEMLKSHGGQEARLTHGTQDVGRLLSRTASVVEVHDESSFILKSKSTAVFKSTVEEPITITKGYFTSVEKYPLSSTTRLLPIAENTHFPSIARKRKVTTQEMLMVDERHYVPQYESK